MLRLWGTHHEAQCGVENGILNSRSFVIYTFYASATNGTFSRFSYFSTPPSSSGPTSHSHGRLIVSNPIHTLDQLAIESPQLDKEYRIPLRAYEI